MSLFLGHGTIVQMPWPLYAIKSLELHYTMIQFFYNISYPTRPSLGVKYHEMYITVIFGFTQNCDFVVRLQLALQTETDTCGQEYLLRQKVKSALFLSP